MITHALLDSNLMSVYCYRWHRIIPSLDLHNRSKRTLFPARSTERTLVLVDHVRHFLLAGDCICRAGFQANAAGLARILINLVAEETSALLRRAVPVPDMCVILIAETKYIAYSLECICLT